MLWIELFLSFLILLLIITAVWIWPTWRWTIVAYRILWQKQFTLFLVTFVVNMYVQIFRLLFICDLHDGAVFFLILFILVIFILLLFIISPESLRLLAFQIIPHFHHSPVLVTLVFLFVFFIEIAVWTGGGRYFFPISFGQSFRSTWFPTWARILLLSRWSKTTLQLFFFFFLLFDFLLGKRCD